MTLPTKEELNAYDMSEVAKLFKPCPEIAYLYDAAGMNHYRLLRWIGENYKEKFIYDVGTYMGLSAGSLIYGGGNKIFSFDINFSAVKLSSEVPVQYTKVPHEDSLPFLLPLANIILVDTWHNGIMEKKIFDTLVAEKWNGILIYDDIYYNDAMKAFWASIDHPGKIDATDIGHSTGTGIIEFKW